MSKQPDKENINKSSDRDINKNVHFLDYSASSIAESWSQGSADESNGFAPNRANITAATWDCAYFQDFFSQVVDRKETQRLVIPVETAPFFHDYISAIQKYPEWKTLGQQDFPPELMENLLQSAYTSINSAPEQLSYYEKILCQTEEYCSFAASKLWAEELDYRCALLKELLSHHSGLEQLKGLISLIRTLDTYIADYSESIPEKSENTSTQFLQEIPNKLYQQVRQNNRHPGESATNFLLRQKFASIPFEEGQEPEDPIPDTEPFEIIDTSKVFSLSKVNKVVRNKRFYDKPTRHQITEHARRIYLTSLRNRIESSQFWMTYDDLKLYLKSVVASAEIPRKEVLTIMAQHCKYIWTHGTCFPHNFPINQCYNMTDVMLDTLALEEAKTFVENFRSDVLRFKYVKDLISTSLFTHDGWHPYIPTTPEQTQQFIKYLSNYLGNSFSKEINILHPNITSMSLSDILPSLYNLYTNAAGKWNIKTDSNVTYHLLCLSVQHLLRLDISDTPDFSFLHFSQVSDIFEDVPVFYYILYTLKLYYYCLDAADKIIVNFQKYHSAMEDFRKSHHIK